ncbi:MAG TPA: proton-conducting transporter membrane subunit [Longimicrobiales bacterium]|nr:proton-conducting transporter membrane subunit [Longimicrobiales bacterium]
MTTSNLPVLLFVIPFVASLFAAGGGWLVRGAEKWVTLAALALTAALSLLALPQVLASGSLHTHLGGWAPPIGIEVLLDPLSAFMAVVVSVVAFIVVAGAGPQIAEELHGRETVWYATVLLLTSGLMGLVITNDLFNLFVQIEVVSLSAYALVAAGGRGAPRAGLNYLIIGSMGASMYLIGAGFLFAATGSLNITDVAARLGEADPRLALSAGLLIVAGLGIKMALFPLHVWMPRAYAVSPTVSASLMAPLVTKVSAYALLRVIFWVFGAGTLVVEELLLHVIAWAGALAALFGGVLAFLQKDIRRLLAYSSVGQMGIVALGIGIANTSGLTGAVLHIASDALMKAVLFLAAGIALLRFGVRNVDELHLLRGRAPWTAAAMTVALLSLVGVPPLSGFFGKWYVLSAALIEGRWALAAALVIGSLATIGYSFRIIEKLYFTPVEADAAGPREGQVPVVAACVVMAALLVVVGLSNDWIVRVLVLPGLPGMAAFGMVP